MAPFLDAGGMSSPEEGVFHKLRMGSMCREPRVSWMPPGIRAVWGREVWASSVTGPGGYRAAGPGGLWLTPSLPQRGDSPHTEPYIGNVGTCSWHRTELGAWRQRHKGKAAAPVAHGTALEGLKLGNLAVVICYEHFLEFCVKTGGIKGFFGLEMPLGTQRLLLHPQHLC